MANSYHRSFRLSPASYTLGRRVVPRLLYVHVTIWLFRLALIVGGVALSFVLVSRIPAIQPQNRPFGIVGAIGYLLIGLAMNYIGFWLGRRLMQRCGFISEAEASVYHALMYRWPESWLEDIPEPEDESPKTMNSGEPGRAPEHSVSRMLKSGFSARAQ